MTDINPIVLYALAFVVFGAIFAGIGWLVQAMMGLHNLRILMILFGSGGAVGIACLFALSWMLGQLGNKG